jgi:hypothetical protein
MEKINVKATNRLDTTLFESSGSKMVAEQNKEKIDIPEVPDFIGRRYWI